MLNSWQVKIAVAAVLYSSYSPFSLLNTLATLLFPWGTLDTLYFWARLTATTQD
jgi:hypothetical protein